jgi:hypothetical protein
MVDTIISFIVSVPVLSVLMALVEPRVSTSVRFLTIAFLGCFAPLDDSAETNAGIPVGMAEMAIAVPSNRSRLRLIPRTAPPTTMSTR